METKDIQSNIKEAIVKTIAYFDLFDFPLTAGEIWKFLYAGEPRDASRRKRADLSMDAVSAELEKKGLRRVIDGAQGFYCLADRSEIIDIRKSRYAISGRKYQRALRAARVFKFLPWIRMIAVGNLMGAHNTRDGSDIDLFVVTQQGRIWITRLLAVGITKLLGWRASENDKKDKICLTFFVSDDLLDLSGYQSKQSSEAADIYFIYWIANLHVLYAADEDVEGEFWSANGWISDYLPHWRPSRSVERRRTEADCHDFCRKVLDLFLGGLDPRAGRWQMAIMAPELEKIMNKDTRVIMNDQVLKMHADDRRQEYSYRWNESVQRILKTMQEAENKIYDD